MSTTNISYNNFQPDWWDTVGITAETVKASIENSINEAFGSTGVTAIQKTAMVEASYIRYHAQQAVKAAAKTAQEASQYADLPDSPAYKNAISTVRAYENIAFKAYAQADQVMKILYIEKLAQVESQINLWSVLSNSKITNPLWSFGVIRA